MITIRHDEHWAIIHQCFLLHIEMMLHSMKSESIYQIENRSPIILKFIWWDNAKSPENRTKYHFRKFDRLCESPLDDIERKAHCRTKMLVETQQNKQGNTICDWRWVIWESSVEKFRLIRFSNTQWPLFGKWSYCSKYRLE